MILSKPLHCDDANDFRRGFIIDRSVYLGKYAERDLPDYSSRNFEERGFTIGIGGCGGSQMITQFGDLLTMCQLALSGLARPPSRSLCANVCGRNTTSVRFYQTVVSSKQATTDGLATQRR